MTYSFNKNATQRIVSTVKAFERQPKNTIPPRNHGGGGDGSNNKGFWACLTNGNGGTGKYSWVGVKYDVDGKMVKDESDKAKKGDGTKDTGYAIEAKNHSRHCVIGDFVYLTPTVIDKKKVFCFDYDGTVKFGTFTSAIKKNFDTNSAQYVELRKINYDHQTPTIEQSTQVRVFNIYSKDVKPRSNGYIQIVFIDGVWIVTGADCG
ncbi:MAG: hypothetical protein U0929_16540 [Planctomycetaceae bacterium]